MRRLWILPFLLTVVIAAGCSNLEPEAVNPPGGKSFWALKIRPGSNTPYTVPAFFVGQNQHVAVYLEAGKEVSKSVIDNLLNAFSSSIVPVEHSVFGTPLGLNTDGRVILLLLDIDDGYTPGNGYVAGYYDSRNIFRDSSVKASYGTRSNEAEMLYLDIYPSVAGSTEFLATAAHEYQHLLQFAKNYRNDTLEETWVDEGLSEVASDLAGYGPQSGRLQTFRTSQTTSFGGIQGDSLIQWSNELADYAHVYVYFRYLADVYGTNVLNKVFNNTSNGVAGLRSALSSVGAATSCGGSTSDVLECSYRNMWGSILQLTTYGQSMRDSSTANLSGAFSSALNFTTISPTVATPSYTSAFSLPPLGFRTFGKSSGNTASLGCTSCNLTLVQKLTGTNFVVFNHSSSTSSGSTSITGAQITEVLPATSLSVMELHNIGPKLHFRVNLTAQEMHALPLAEPAAPGDFEE